MRTLTPLTPRLARVALACVLSLSIHAHAGKLPTPGYQTDLASAVKITEDLHRALDEKQQGKTTAELVVLKNADQPVIRGVMEGGKPSVGMSEVCVQFLNRISHAKSIDADIPGYYGSYVKLLAAMQPGEALPELPPHPETAWSLDGMNLQASHFNQMAGSLVAIEMAHHYLGHYAKHAGASENTADASFHAALSGKEYREAVLKGSKNALNCGLGVAGLRSLVESLDQMPSRPDWTYELLPKSADASKIAKELKRMESSFFLTDY